MQRSTRTRLHAAAVGGVLIATGALVTEASATKVRFSTYTPLAASSGPTADEAMPITFGNPTFGQRSIADRSTQLAAGIPNSGNFDMITLNEDGPDAGRYLFTVFETGQAGVQRQDLQTGAVETVWYSPAFLDHVAFDAAYWTPWGTFITAEEAWCTGASGCTDPIFGRFGRLFELRNPLTAPGITTANPSNAGADFVHANVIPRTSHEGIQFDKKLNMYFIDELNGGTVFKYTPKAKKTDILNRDADYFAAGQTFVLRVGDGSTPNATGAYSWVPITDVDGNPLPGAISVTDANGVTSVDGRNTADLPAFKGTEYQRPEDLQIRQTDDGELLYMATTTTNEVYVLNLEMATISVFANTSTIDLATGAGAGSALRSPDNLALDSKGNIYVIEDRNGGVDDDIWFANDLNRDGDLLDAGEGIGRWASNGTLGSEFTGLYFDPFNEDRAWVNIQHPTSGNDRTIEITLPS